MSEKPAFEEQRMGNLAVRLALSDDEVRAAQALRYQVFHEEMGAQTHNEAVDPGLDVDEYDAVCDHLLVLDYDLSGPSPVVGTYRLLRREPMKKVGRFYTENEFDISRIKLHPGEIMEMGRSCVNKNYRNKMVMQLLWRGLGMYVDVFNIKMMFGCASFAGTDVQAHAESLSYLYHYHLAPEQFRPTSLPGKHVAMNLIPKEQFDAKRAFAALPTLIKGYLRAGGYVGDSAFVDFDYNTVDVSIAVETKVVTDKYVQRYSPNPDSLKE